MYGFFKNVNVSDGVSTCMSAEVSSQCISSPTGVAAEGTFEGLLPRVQLDVSKQITLLSEGGTALIALERSLT